MEKNVNRVCYTCGGTSFIKINSRTLKCEYCGNVIENNDSLSSEVITFLNQGDACRRKIDFENAEEYYSLAKEKDVTCAEAYFGLLMCEYGVTHVKDPVTEIMKPTLNRLSETPIKESLFYKKLFECLFDNESKKIYQKKCDELEEIRKKSLEISKSKKGYDIFISFKKTPFETGNGDYTKDYVEAKELYNKLNNDHRFKGKVFFSEETLKDYAGEDYEPVIYNALKTSKLMFVFSSKKEYGNAGWVKNEWTRFLKMKTQDTSKILITIILNTIEDLPEPLQKIQGIFCDKNYNENLNKKVNEVFKNGTSSFGKGEKIVELNVTKHIDIDKIEEGNGFSGVGTSISTSENAVLSQIDASLKVKKFKDAEALCEALLTKNQDNSYVLWKKLYCTLKAKDDSEFVGNFFSYCPDLELIKKIFNNASEEEGGNCLYTLVNAIYRVLSKKCILKIEYFDNVVSFCYSYLTKDDHTLSGITQKISLYIDTYLNNKTSFNGVYSKTELIKLGNLILKAPNISKSEDIFAINAERIADTFFNISTLKENFYSISKTFYEKAYNAKPDLYIAFFRYNLSCKETNEYTMYKKINEKNYEEYDNILKDLLERKFKIATSNGNLVANSSETSNNIYYYFHETVCKLALNNQMNVAKLFFKKYITYSYFKTENLSLYISELYFFANLLLSYSQFEEAKEYFNEIISCKNNSYQSFIGLLCCEAKCNNIVDLLLSKYKIGESKNYFSALTIAGNYNKGSYIQDFYVKSLSLTKRQKKDYIEMNKSCKKYHLSIYFDKFATSGFSTVIGNYKNVQNDLFFDNYYNATNEKVNYNKILNNNFSKKMITMRKSILLLVLSIIFVCFTTPLFLRKHVWYVQVYIPFLTYLLLILLLINKLPYLFCKVSKNKIEPPSRPQRIFRLIKVLGLFLVPYFVIGTYYLSFSSFIETNEFLQSFGYYLTIIISITILTIIFGLSTRATDIVNKEDYSNFFEDKKENSCLLNINKKTHYENRKLYKKVKRNLNFSFLLKTLLTVIVVTPIIYFTYQPTQNLLNNILSYDYSVMNIVDYKEDLSDAKENEFIKIDNKGKRYISINDKFFSMYFEDTGGINTVDIVGDKNKTYDFYFVIEDNSIINYRYATSATIYLYNININYTGSEYLVYYKASKKITIHFICDDNSKVTTQGPISNINSIYFE